MCADVKLQKTHMSHWKEQEVQYVSARRQEIRWLKTWMEFFYFVVWKMGADMIADWLLYA